MGLSSHLANERYARPLCDIIWFEIDDTHPKCYF